MRQGRIHFRIRRSESDTGDVEQRSIRRLSYHKSAFKIWQQRWKDLCIQSDQSADERPEVSEPDKRILYPGRLPIQDRTESEHR